MLNRVTGLLGGVFVVVALLALAPRAPAADQAPVVGPGATREEVINAYGWPSGLSQAGTKEILTYPQGRITLENGRVEKVDFLPNVPWPAPRPRPAPASPTSVKKTESYPDFWLVHLEDAQKEAKRRNARILAAFIGSDWSPPSRQFQEEVAFHPDFVNTFTGDFVFLRLDFPTRTQQPPEIREQNARLRAAYNVTTYPSLLVLSPAGTAIAAVDLTKPQEGANYRERVIAAVREVRDLLVVQPPAPDPTPQTEAPAQPEAAPTPAQEPVVSSAMSSAKRIVIAALAIGLILAAAGWYFMWRTRPDDVGARSAAMAARISDAASGLPSVTEIAEWPKERLREIVGRLAESEGYAFKVRGGGDGDLALFHRGQETPSVIVNCQPGAAGSVSAKRVRELFGTITVEGVKTGWFVSPMGFSHEARDYAREHQLVLMDAEELLEQMRGVPPLLLRKILAG